MWESQYCVAYDDYRCCLSLARCCLTVEAQQRERFFCVTRVCAGDPVRDENKDRISSRNLKWKKTKNEKTRVASILGSRHRRRWSVVVGCTPRRWYMELHKSRPWPIFTVRDRMPSTIETLRCHFVSFGDRYAVYGVKKRRYRESRRPNEIETRDSVLFFPRHFRTFYIFRTTAVA